MDPKWHRGEYVVSISIPEHPSQKASQLGSWFAKRFELVDKETLVTKTVYVRSYHRRRRKKSKDMRDVSLQPLHTQTQAERRKDGVEQPNQEMQRQAISVALERLVAKLEESQNRRLRALSFEITKPFSEMQTRLESSIREAIVIPKLKFFEFKFDHLLDVKRIHKDAVSNVVGAMSSSQSGAMRDALQIQSRLTEILRAVSYRSNAFDKLFDVHRVYRESVSIALAEVLDAHRNAIKQAIQAQLEIADASREPTDLVFRQLLNAVREGMEAPSGEALEAMFEIQSKAIPEELQTETILTLVDFIQKHRGTNSQKVLVAVGAAIRKVLLNLPSDEIALASELLKSEGSLTIPIEVELEVAKMVVHRFRYSPDIESASLSELASLLAKLATLYSHPNLINRDKYGATALNSFLAVLLMQHPDSNSLCEQIGRTAPAWFLDSVRSRLRRLLADIREKEGDSFAGLTQWIQSLPIMAGSK